MVEVRKSSVGIRDPEILWGFQAVERSGVTLSVLQ